MKTNIIDFILNGGIKFHTIYFGVMGILFLSIGFYTNKKAKNSNEIKKRMEIARIGNIACSFIMYLFSFIFVLQQDYKYAILLLVIENIKDKIIIRDLKSINNSK